MRQLLFFSIYYLTSGSLFRFIFCSLQDPSKVDGLYLTRNDGQMHRSILFYLHLLISGLHHHFSIQRHHPPLAGIPFKSTITAYRNTDIPVTRRHYDTISPFQPPLHPHPERKDIFYFLQPLPPFLFLILLPFPLYALRTPPGFLPQTFHHGGKIRFARRNKRYCPFFPL